MNARVLSFTGGEVGPWRVVSISTVVGGRPCRCWEVGHRRGRCPTARRCEVAPPWIDKQRVVRHSTREKSSSWQKPTLGRPQATRAALIPIRKTGWWWALAQDERRRIFEERSKHVATGLRYLPAVARRLHHCRDLGENEPFDFLTWFDTSDSAAFDELVAGASGFRRVAYVDRERSIFVWCGLPNKALVNGSRARRPVKVEEAIPRSSRLSAAR